MFKQLKQKVVETQQNHKLSQSDIKKANEERKERIKKYRLQNKQQSLK